MSCIRNARSWIQSHGLVSPDSRVIVAVSGGSDSMALLEILRELSGELHCSLAAAHFDHRIRQAGPRERALVERYTAARGIPLIIGGADVPREAKRRKLGLEEAAREARYRFLEKTAGSWGAAAVALGHTRDDQIETVLHHIIRGTGWRGLAGMPVRRGIFIRPLLACGRGELIDFLRARSIRYAVDESNRDNRLLRNRIRNRLLPYLRKHFNPAIDDAILRLKDNIREGRELLEQNAIRQITGTADEVRIPLSLLEGCSDFEIYLLVDLVLRERFGIHRDVGKRHFDAAKRLVRSGRSGSHITMPHGITVSREHGTIMLRRTQKGEPAAPGTVLLPGAGDYLLPSWGMRVQLSEIDPRGQDLVAGGREALLAAVRWPLRIRQRLPGDRIVPLGMRGHKKLSDMLIDHKVPVSRRERIPVFEDARGMILWVPGVATAESARVTRRTRKAVQIKLIPEPIKKEGGKK